MSDESPLQPKASDASPVPSLSIDALAQSERRFQALIEHSTDSIAVIDSSNKILYLSPAVERVEGFKPEELIGTSGVENTHPDDLPYVGKVVEELMAHPGKPVPVLWRRKHKDGRWLWLEGYATNLLDDPAVQGIVTNYRDVTDRKTAEDALRKSEERLRGTLDSMMEGFQIIDPEWRYVFINETGVQHARKTHDELIGRTMMEVYPGIDQTDVFKQMEQCMSGRKPIHLENHFVYPDGNEAWFDLRIQPTVEGIFVLSSDITQQKAAEQARESLETQLHESQKMEALGTLAGGIAHDFNNILGAILGNAELAQQDARGNPELLESIGEIRKAALRAKELIQQILSFARRQPKSLKVMNLCPVAEDSIRLLRSTLTTTVSIDYQCKLDTPNIVADATQIQQVILNLCTNAAHALQGQPGRIDVRVGPQDIEEGALPPHPDLAPGKYAKVSIADTGVGMDEATLQRVFEPFFTTKPVGEGTGLGLAVAHGIMKAHGGAIAIHSTVGVGTRVELFFPATDQAVPAESEVEVGQKVQGRGQRILHIDDDESLVLLVKRMLERQGYKVSSFGSQLEALREFRMDPYAFDAVLTDYNMFGASGLDVIAAVREIRPEIPIALASGYITEELRQLANEAGVRELIAKPNTVDDYCAVVERLLRE